MTIMQRNMSQVGVLKNDDFWRIGPFRFCMFKSLAKKGKSSWAAGHVKHFVTKVKEPFHSKVVFEMTPLGR